MSSTGGIGFRFLAVVGRSSREGEIGDGTVALFRRLCGSSHTLCPSSVLFCHILCRPVLESRILLTGVWSGMSLPPVSRNATFATIEAVADLSNPVVPLA